MITIQAKRLLINSSVYFVGNLAARAVSFLLIPLYTKLLDPLEYGSWAIMLSICGFFSPFFQMGLHDAVGRYYFKYQDGETFKQYFSTVLNFLFFLTFLLEIILIILTPQLLTTFLGNRTYLLLLMLLMIDLALSSFVQLFASLFQYAEKAVHFSVLQFGRSVLNLFLVFLLVIYYKIGINGFGIALFVSDLVFLIACLIIFSKFYSFKIHFQFLKDSLKYGFPFLLTAILGWLSSYSTNIFIGKIQSPFHAGLFSLAFNVSMIVNFVCTSIQQVWNPMFMKNMEINSTGFQQRTIQFQTYYMAFVAIVGVGISLLSNEIFQLFIDPRYYDGWKIIPIVMYYYLFVAMAQQFYLKLCFVQKTKYLFYANLIAAVISIAANLIFIKYFSLYGAAIALALVGLFLMAIYYYYSQRYLHFVYQYKNAVIIFIVFVIGTVSALTLNFSLYLNIMIKACTFSLLLLILVCSNTISYGAIKSLFIKT